MKINLNLRNSIIVADLNRLSIIAIPPIVGPCRYEDLPLFHFLRPGAGLEHVDTDLDAASAVAPSSSEVPRPTVRHFVAHEDLFQSFWFVKLFLSPRKTWSLRL